MGSTLVSSPIIVQQPQQKEQTDDLLLHSISALSQRNKMSTSLGTGNRRKQKHSSMWMNVEDYMHVPVPQSTSSSSSSSTTSDMTLPTPPRSPSAEIGFDDTMNGYDDEEEYQNSQGIPEPLLDDLLELWCEEADFTNTGDGSEEISIHNALTELGFDPLVSNDGQNDSMSETEHAENMIDHLLANCKASYLSPPPTNPSSPKMQADSEVEEHYMLSSVKSEATDSSSNSVTEEVEEEVITSDEVIENEAKYEIKIEESEVTEEDDEMMLPHQDENLLQNLIDCDGMMNFEIDEQLLVDNMDKFDQTFDAMQAISETSNSAAKSVEKFMDSLKTEPLDNDEEIMGDQILENDDSYDLFGEPKSKKGRYDFEDEFLSEFPDIKQDCMWNGFLGGDMNLSPSAILGGASWKQEYTFETLFEEKEKLEVTAQGSSTSVPQSDNGTTAAVPVVHDAQIKTETKDDIAARLAAEEEEKKKKQLEDFRIAFDNDHRYALTYDDRYAKDVANKTKMMSASATQPRKVIQGIIVKSEPQTDKIGGGTTTKKTKILVPLKDLMETLQQKSFLVSPLGPNKKIIRFTGSDSVKGVLSTANFQSAAIMAGQSTASGSRTISTVPTKPNHNVRKRPHTLKSPKIEITPALSPLDMDLETSSSPLLSSSIVSSSTGSSSPSSSANPSSSTSTKKKTKAHNNMERMRRIDLRNSFDNLKKLVPPLAKIPKCSKVEILRRAEEYIKGLRNQEKRLIKEEMQVRQRNAQLRSRLEATSSSMNMTSSINSSSSISCSN